MIRVKHSHTLTLNERRKRVVSALEQLLPHIGESAIDSLPYDTSWIARLAQRFPGYGFEKAIVWLREHQQADGSWGSSLLNYHDRAISTLSAIVALRMNGDEPGDAERVRRGERYLWQIGGKMHRDPMDTIGYSLLIVPLINEALSLGLDVPRHLHGNPAIVEKKLKLLGEDPRRWRYTSMSFSLEAIRGHYPEQLDFLEEDGSVGDSPAATAALLLYSPRISETSLRYIADVVRAQGDGGAPVCRPIDVFETAWSVHYLHLGGVLTPEQPEMERLLSLLSKAWRPHRGAGWSSRYSVPDLDDTALSFAALAWGGYPVDAEVFAPYEEETHFHCYPGEIEPSMAVNLRTLRALTLVNNHAKREAWIQKILSMLRKASQSGDLWYDKWHISPYYLACTLIASLQGVADDLSQPYIDWIVRTQSRDGGWGHYQVSTVEETAYSMLTLTLWHRTQQAVDLKVLEAGADYLFEHMNDTDLPPQWIGKCLYTPRTVVRAVALSALYAYLQYVAD